MAPKTNSIFPHYTDSAVFIKEVETERVITRERTYTMLRPVCQHCGETMERAIVTTPSGNRGMFWACGNVECPSHDPAPGAAIPLPAEGKTIIDVEPIRRAA
jgi:hypothetical protein